jgi:ApbE superfamily uncharacterized protein (UPF0280 family)
MPQASPCPTGAGAIVVVPGIDPPFDIPAGSPPPSSQRDFLPLRVVQNPSSYRAVPLTSTDNQMVNPAACELLASLRRRLFHVRPPRPRNDGLDGVRREHWQERCAQSRREFWQDPTVAGPLVAGSVAQELIGLLAQDGVHKAYVNNGGDIALHLQEGNSWRIGVVSDLHKALASDVATDLVSDLVSDGHFVIDHSMPVRGVATSGWQGRSFSLGIADSVTVLAATAAQADVAATLIANAVNIDHPAIQRQPANSLRDDSDLGQRLVTVDVPRLASTQVEQALQLGLDCAHAMQARGQVVAVYLCCQGRTAVTQTLECLV